MTKTDIDSIISWLIDQSNDGKIDIHNHKEFFKDLRGAFRTLHEINCKNFFADGQCLQGGRGDGNCQRMKNYDKKFLNQPVGDSDKF